MNTSSQTAQSSTAGISPDAVREALAGALEDDLALGWECANPALQIETWGREPVSVPFQALI